MPRRTHLARALLALTGIVVILSFGSADARARRGSLVLEAGSVRLVLTW